MSETWNTGDVVRLGEFSGTKRQQAMVWTVTNIETGPRGIKYEITPVGGGLPLLCDGWQLIAGSDADKAKAAAAVTVAVPTLGAVVRVGIVLKNHTPETLFAVIGVNADQTVKIAKLGGDGNKYVNKVPMSKVTIVDLAEAYRASVRG